MDNRLFRSRTDIMIGGVCGGLARYLRVDATLVRLFFVLLALGGNGIGILVYLLLWMILPLEGKERNATLQDNVRSSSEEIAERTRMMGKDLQNIVSNPNPRTSLIFGSAFIILGTIFLLQNLNISWLYWLKFDVVGPILLIIGGAALLIRHLRGG